MMFIMPHHQNASYLTLQNLSWHTGKAIVALFRLNNTTITIIQPPIIILEEGESHQWCHYAVPHHYRLVGTIMGRGSYVDLYHSSLSSGKSSKSFFPKEGSSNFPHYSTEVIIIILVLYSRILNSARLQC